MIGKTVGELSPFKDIEPNKVMLERLQKEGMSVMKPAAGDHSRTPYSRRICQQCLSSGYRQGDQCNIATSPPRNGGATNPPPQRRSGATGHGTHGATQASNVELEAFSYSVSHDLRAPLRGVKVCVEQMQRDTGHRVQKMITTTAMIHKSVDRMGN